MPAKKLVIGSMILAKDVPNWAGYFRKPAGTYVYLRIAPSSAEYYGLNTEAKRIYGISLTDNKVYGVCFNGNMVALSPLKPVVLCDVFDMARNICG